MERKNPLSFIKRLTPGQLLILYYAVSILAGSALLSLPAAAQNGSLSFIDALFTATSAQCVTGLTVVDTGTSLSLFGQMVVLGLIQLGGLGVTTFSVYLFFFLQLGAGIRGRWIIHETLLHSPMSSLRELVRGIIFMALAIETAGVIILAAVFVPRLGLGKGLFSALFHSISAFCNAGFSLFPDSLISYRGNMVLNVTIMVLIVLGGIGFLVIREVRDIILGRGKRLSLHSKVVLWTSAILILGGAGIIAASENTGALNGLPIPEKVATAFFQSVTARTAGFNTIDMNALSISTLLLMIFLMFVGASPGSAGGGIKTTSLALFAAILYNRLKGNRSTNIFRRTVSDEAVSKALALFLLAFLVVGVGLFALLLVQHPGSSSRQHDAVFLQYLFETVSAFATVGLSMGATALLTVWGKALIVILMFVGRVGLLTLAFTIAGRVSPIAPRYAQENLMIG